MADLFVSESLECAGPTKPGKRVVLADDGYYWFLYWYFEAANLPPRKHELIDLYSDAELSGYQLERFIAELEEARADALSKPEHWNVLTGWNGENMSRESERRVRVERSRVLALVDELLSLAREALSSGLKLISIGD
jgi:hypothetical protein